MATAPTVQTLDQIMGELQPSVQGQVDVINQQKQANAAIYDAQRAGLDAAKVKGFNDINTQATGRGMSFSGIPLNEQAEYLSYKYLPGVQAANAQQNADALAYDRQAADLNANIFNKAFDWRNQQVLTLNDWNKMLAGQDFSRSERIAGQDWQSNENKLGRDFQASESQKARDFQAAQNAASRAASAAYGGGGGGSGGGSGGSGLGSFITDLNAARNTEGPYRGIVSDKILGQMVAQASLYGISEAEARKYAHLYSVRAK